MEDDEKQRQFELAERLLSEQNFAAAVVAGVVAALLGAVAYGIVVTIASFSYGFAAAGLGIVVGLSMQYLGRGISTKFAVVAIALTIAGCVLGNLFRVVVGIARAGSISPIDVLRQEPLPMLVERSLSYLSLIDIVFWLVAVFCAGFLALRPLSRRERLAVGLFDARG